MPTLLTQSFENIPAGVTPTTANSGGGSDTGITTVSPGAGGLMVASTAITPAHGTKCLAITPASGAVDYWSWALNVPGATQWAARVYVNFPTVPPPMAFMQVRSTVGQVATFGFNSGGHFVFQNGNLPTVNTIWTSTNVVPTNTWLRFDMLVQIATSISGSTGNGILSMAYYPLDSMTATETFSSRTANTGTAALSEIRFGKLSGTMASVFYMDNAAVEDGQTTFLSVSSAVAPNPPTGITVSPGITSVACTCTAPAYDGGGTITQYIFTASSGQQAVSSTPSATIGGLAAGVPISVTAQAVNSAGTSAASVASTIVTPLGATQTVYPVADVTVTGWTPNIGSTVWGVTDEPGAPDDTNYATSVGNPSNVSLDVKMGTPLTPADNNGWSAIVRLEFVNGTSGTASIRLRQGSAGAIISSVAGITLTTGFADYAIPITSTQAANITDLTDLHIQLYGVTAS